MLVLSRKIGEAIVFPALDITVTVSQLRGKCVSLGIEAPDDVSIIRKELVPKLQAICASKLGANLSHQQRNYLNSVGLSLNILLRQMESGREPDVNMLKKAIGDLHTLDESANRREPEQTDFETSKKLALIVDDNENESALLEPSLQKLVFARSEH